MSGCNSGRRLTREDIPPWITVDSNGAIWTTKARGGGRHDARCEPRRAERATARGYLNLRLPSGIQTAHRVVYAYVNGETPAGVLVRHLNGLRTDNRPRNLALGTNQDNMDDAKRHGSFVNKGRAGERNNRAKLDADDVRAIRAAYAAGETQTALAKRYPVGQAAISYIVRHETWAHID